MALTPDDFLDPRPLHPLNSSPSRHQICPLLHLRTSKIGFSSSDHEVLLSVCGAPSSCRSILPVRVPPEGPGPAYARAGVGFPTQSALSVSRSLLTHCRVIWTFPRGTLSRDKIVNRQSQALLCCPRDQTQGFAVPFSSTALSS